MQRRGSRIYEANMTDANRNMSRSFDRNTSIINVTITDLAFFYIRLLKIKASYIGYT